MGMDTTKWVLVATMAYSCLVTWRLLVLDRALRRSHALRVAMEGAMEAGTAVLVSAGADVRANRARVAELTTDLGHAARRNDELRERVRELNPAEFAATDDAGDVIRAITGGTGLSDDGE